MMAIRKRFLVAAVLLATTMVQPARSQEQDDRGTPEAKPAETGRAPGYRLQEYDDEAFPLRPVTPRSAAMQSRIDALSWYMVGRLFDREHRGDASRALEAFRKSVALDPEAKEIYRELVPLEFDAKNLDAAIRYATKHIQIDPDDYNSRQRLAIMAANTGHLPEAIKFFEQAIKSPRINKESLEYVELNSLLGQLYVTTGQKDLAADCFEILFDALKSPEKYHMDRRIQKEFLRNPRTDYEQIGQILQDANRLKLALEAFELAAKGSKLSQGNLNFNRAKILFLTEKYEEALEELQKYIDSQRISKGRQPYQLLADILAKLNRSDELIQRLEAIVENDQQNAALQYFFADRLAEVNELERARTIYTTVLKNGGDVSGYVGLARVLRKLKKPGELLEVLGRSLKRGEEAIDLLQPEFKAFSEDKELMDSLFDAGRERAKNEQLKYEEALLLAKFGAFKDAETAGEFYRQAISLYRGDNEELLNQLHLEMGEMYVKFKKYDQACEVYNEMLMSNRLKFGDQLSLYYSLARAQTNANRIDAALEAVNKGIDLCDDKGEVRGKIAFRNLETSIYTHAKRWDEAILKLDQLIRDYPDNKELVTTSQISLSNVYVQKGDIRRGEEVLEKVLEGNHDNAHANNDLGYLWADQGKNLERAEAMIRKALVSDPENAAYLDSLGWVLFKLGRYEDALPPLEQSTQKSIGGDATLWDHLGDVLLKLMRIEKAVEAWKTGIEHLQEDPSPDKALLERMQEKVKQHGAGSGPKPAEKGTP